ncbi:MAG: dTMP kinase [Buchananella hordeovulneris]|nr:dTMP kinase [Buchananella hordeovulneris]
MHTPFAPQPTVPATGLFVAFEGGDGSGKTTQVRVLAERLIERGLEVSTSREPGGTPLGEAIRELLLHGEDMGARAEALLYAASRAQHVDERIRPAMERGAVFITDRYWDSSIAYQGAARALGGEEIAALSHWATGGLAPHLTVLLDLPVEEASARRRNVGRSAEDRLERETVDFHERVRASYLALAARAPERYLVLDARQSPQELAAQIWARVEGLLR